MKKDAIERRPKVAFSILALGIVAYAFLCRPAIVRRGYPEIDPFWLAMPYLWPAPIPLSAIFDENSRLRRWSLAAYCVLAAFFIAGVGVLMLIVPHHVTIAEMLLGMLFWSPPMLLLGFGAEILSQNALGRIRAFASPSELAPHAFPVRVLVVFMMIAAMTAAYPVSVHQIAFASATRSAIADAENDWASGKAILYVDRNANPVFGSEIDGYDIATGLRTEHIHGGVTDTIYKEAYRTVIAAKLATYGPAPIAKNLFTRDELAALLAQARFRKVASIPRRQGSSKLYATDGYTIGRDDQPEAERHAAASKYIYAAEVPEKNNALVVMTDSDILIYGPDGNILQDVTQWSEPEWFANPPATSPAD